MNVDALACAAPAPRQHPQNKFATVARTLGERCTVWIAWRQDEPISGIINLTRGPRVTYWRGAMDKERSRGTGANELLHRLRDRSRMCR
ncbi:MAG: GNAT family N-acetyltransferase [Pseudonocardiaceae bacterium]